MTDDVDLTLITGFGSERPFINALLTWLKPRRADAAEFAERHRVLLLQTESGVGIDVALGALPFEELAVQRARDVEMTIVRQGDSNLDWKYIREQLVPLLELKEQPGLLTELEALRARLLRNP